MNGCKVIFNIIGVGMKKYWMIGVLVILVVLVGVQVQVQSKVEIYGFILGGVGYFINQGGLYNFEVFLGINQNLCIGFCGQEDLGGGICVIFMLENGFNMMIGVVLQSGCLFGCQFWVGLVFNSMGIMILGCQYEVVKDYLGLVVIVSNGVYIGDNDNGYNNLCVQNLVKYVSLMFNDFNVIVLYGFGEVVGDVLVNCVMSIGFGYKGGNFCWVVVFIQMDQFNSIKSFDGVMGNDYVSLLLIFNKSVVNSLVGVCCQCIVGIGGFYIVGKIDFGVMYSNVKYEYLDNIRLMLQNFDINLVYYYMLVLNLGVFYFYIIGKYDIINKNLKWYQINLQVDYFLFKCIDVVIIYSYQLVVGDVIKVIIFGFFLFSDKKQVVLMLGMCYVF